MSAAESNNGLVPIAAAQVLSYKSRRVLLIHRMSRCQRHCLHSLLVTRRQALV